MVEIKQIKLKGSTALGIKIMKDEKGVVAARIAGINSIETALETNIVEITSKAKEIGLKEGMPLKEALEKLC
jgi:uncharacterized protein YunC (DUF1805 family)